MRKIYQILKDVESLFPDIAVFDIPDIIMEEDLDSLDLNKEIFENSVYLGTGRHHIDIPIGTAYNVIFSREDPLNYIETNAILKYVNVNPTVETDFLPAGYSGLCLMHFPSGKPELLDKLGPFNNVKDRDKHDVLYLTNQEVMDEIIARL